MTSSTANRDVRLSLLLLALVILIACAGLAFDGNWPKVLRVSSAFTSYTLALAAFGVLTAGARTGLGRVAAAGAIAGFVSGVVRPEFDAMLVAASIAGGAAFAAVHWLALTRCRALATRMLRPTP